MALCECGCGQDAGVYIGSGNGHRDGEPRRFLRGHQNSLRRQKSIVVDANECWLWQGGTKDGYPISCIDGRKNVRVHRYNYQQKYGSIPAGMQLHHKCNVPLCVNPDHGEPATNAENQAFRTKFTDEQVAEIKVRRARGERCIDLAKEYGVTFGYISHIARGRALKNLGVRAAHGSNDTVAVAFAAAEFDALLVAVERATRTAVENQDGMAERFSALSLKLNEIVTREERQ